MDEYLHPSEIHVLSLKSLYLYVRIEQALSIFVKQSKMPTSRQIDKIQVRYLPQQLRKYDALS